MNEEQMKVIAELYAENDKLETQNKLLDKKLHELQKENNQLKEQKKELRSWLEEEINNIETLFGGETSMTIGYKTVLSKLNELEGSKNE